jgi:hypothetical protein
MTTGRPLTIVLAVIILAMLALTVLPAQQPPRAPASAGASTLSTLDLIEIQQLVRKYAWATDSGDNYGYAYADLFVPDGVFVGMNQGEPDGRTTRGRDQLAALARGGTRGHTQQSHFTMNHVIRPTAEGATGRVYVVVLDVGVVGRPNRVNHGGHYEDVYRKTPLGWRFARRTYRESKVDVWPASVPRPGE